MYFCVKSSKLKVTITKYAVFLTNTEVGQKGGQGFVWYLRRDYISFPT